jgi:hypothetical protein
MALACRTAGRAYLPGIGTVQRRNSLPGKLGSSGNSGSECYSVVQVISFKNTVLLKRGVWLTAAALIAFAVTPSLLDGSLQQNPASSLFAAGILCAFFVYFLRKTQIHRLADEVMDCDDHLKVRRGRTEETIQFSNIATAEVSTSSGIHRITVRLRQPTKLGAQIEFLPQASLWSNLPGVKRVATSLTDRANQAKGGRETIDST